MLDKIIIVNKHQAYLIFDGDRSPIGISSDKDVVVLLMWFLGSPLVQVATDMWGNATGLELRRNCEDEITQKIELKDVA